MSFVSFVSFVIFLINTIQTSIYWLDKVGPKLEDSLGFKHGSPYVNGHEILLISKVVPGGIMERAGLRIGDVPYGMGMDDFYKMLWEGRGSIVEVEVVNVYDNPSRQSRSSAQNKRVLRIPVPHLGEEIEQKIKE
ncbi:MAG: hypothetical protein NZM04_01780 [Methylacidiphilales bacterium]|nr:hypothetical protein [Candidatus Methylacidiphilales bacterium]